MSNITLFHNANKGFLAAVHPDGERASDMYAKMDYHPVISVAMDSREHPTVATRIGSDGWKEYRAYPQGMASQDGGSGPWTTETGAARVLAAAMNGRTVDEGCTRCFAQAEMDQAYINEVRADIWTATHSDDAEDREEATERMALYLNELVNGGPNAEIAKAGVRAFLARLQG